MNIFLLPLLAITLAVLAVPVMCTSEADSPQALLKQVKQEQDAAEKKKLYLELGGMAAPEIAPELKELVRQEKDPETILAALYAYLRNSFSENDAAQKLFRTADEPGYMDRTSFLEMIGQDIDAFWDIFKEAGFIPSKQLSSRTLETVLEDKTADVRIRAAAVFLSANKRKTYLDSRVSEINGHIPKKGPNILQAAAAVMISASDIFERQEKKLGYSGSVLLTEKYVGKCEKAVEDGSLSPDDLYSILNTSLDILAKYKGISILGFFDPDPKMGSIGGIENNCMFGFIEAESQLIAATEKYSSQFNEFHRKNLLLKMIAVFGDACLSESLFEWIESEFGDSFVEEMSWLVAGSDDETFKYRIDAVLELYSYMVSAGKSGDEEVRKQVAAIEELRESLGFAKAIRFVFDNDMDETETRVFTLTHAMYVKGACLRMEGAGDRLGLFLEYDECSSDLVHLEYVYDNKDMDDEEWFVVVDFNGDIDPGEAIDIFSMEKVNLFFSDMGTFSAAFDYELAMGTFEIESAPDGLQLNLEVVFDGMRYSMNERAYVPGRAQLTGSNKLEQLSFAEFTFRKMKEVDIATGIGGPLNEWEKEMFGIETPEEMKELLKDPKEMQRRIAEFRKSPEPDTEVPLEGEYNNFFISHDFTSMAIGGEPTRVFLKDEPGKVFEINNATTSFMGEDFRLFSDIAVMHKEKDGESSISIVDVKTGEVFLSYTSSVRMLFNFIVASSPSGRYIAAISFSTTKRPRDTKHIVVFDLEEIRILPEITTSHKDEIRSLSFYDDNTVISSSLDGGIEIHDVITGQSIEGISKSDAGPDSFDDYGMLDTVEYSPQLNILAASHWNNVVNLMDWDSGENVLLLQGEGDDLFEDVAFSPDGKKLAAGTQMGGIRIWDLQSGELLQSSNELSNQSRPIGFVAFSPNGKLLFTALLGVAGIYVFNVETGELVETIDSEEKLPWEIIEKY